MKTALLLNNEYRTFVDAEYAAAIHRVHGDEAYAVLARRRTHDRIAIWRVVVVTEVR